MWNIAPNVTVKRVLCVCRMRACKYIKLFASKYIFSYSLFSTPPSLLPLPSSQDQQSILFCLAAVLHICDISFASDDEGSLVANPDKVETVARLLQVDSPELAACLIQEAVVTRGERSEIKNTLCSNTSSVLDISTVVSRVSAPYAENRMLLYM